MAEKKAGGDDSLDEVEKAPTRPVVARPRLLVAMAAAPKLPAEVLQWASVIGVVRRVIGGATARRSYAADAKDGGTLPMPVPRPWADAVDATGGGTLLAADVCPSSKEEAVMAVASEVRARDDDQGTVRASAFKAEGAGTYGDGSEEGEPAWQVGDEAWICDSGASTHMTPSADCMINSRECHLKLRIDSGSTRSIEGYGDIRVIFRSGNDLVQVLLTNVAQGPDLGHHLFSLPTLVEHGHTFEGPPHGSCSQAQVRAFDRVSAERDPLQPVRLPGRSQLWENCPCCARPRATAQIVCD